MFIIDFIQSLYYKIPTVAFCEQPIDFFIKRPFYALSNLAYLFCGLAIIITSKSKLAKAFAYTAILIGILSFVYDSTYSYLFQLIDLTGMLIYITLILFLNIEEIYKKSSKVNLLIRTFLVIVSLLIIYILKDQSGNIIFGLFVIITLVSELFLYKKRVLYKYWLIGFIVFLVGFLIWLTDVNKIYCNPSNVINGRGVFHILTAVSIYYLYRFYTSQQKTIEP